MQCTNKFCSAQKTVCSAQIYFSMRKISGHTHDYQEEHLYQDYFQTIFSQGQFEEPNSWQEALALYYRQLLAVAI